MQYFLIIDIHLILSLFIFECFSCFHIMRVSIPWEIFSLKTWISTCTCNEESLNVLSSSYSLYKQDHWLSFLIGSIFFFWWLISILHECQLTIYHIYIYIYIYIYYVAYEIVHKFFKVRLNMKSYKTTSTRTLVVEAGKTE